ncbi:hypothetical protein [Inquilinus limosus]|uniref:hypothetical protein n=1 Tax=Inquilinus limosus TaxID=171674 RepID=UPI0012DE2B54|nr:hypothetical protein [Inquilinus limosus]
MRFRSGILIALGAASLWPLGVRPLAAQTCEIADIFFDEVRLDIVPKYDDDDPKRLRHEYAIVSYAGFDAPKVYGALKGRVSPERAGFAVYGVDGVMVGFITPSGQLQSVSKNCDRTTYLSIRRLRDEIYVVVNGKTPVGIIQGRFPRNEFGFR